MSFIAIIFHFTKAHLNVEIFQGTRADTAHKHSCCNWRPICEPRFPFPKTSWIVGSSAKGCIGMSELRSENEEEFKKLKGTDSSLGREQKVILLECNLFLS